MSATEASRRYRSAVLTALRSRGWGRDVAEAARRAMRHLHQQRSAALAPSYLRAGRTAARTLFFMWAPLVVASWLWTQGWALAALPLLVLSAMAFYGGVAIVHDLAHGAFFPGKPANEFAGYLFAPLLLMHYGGFRRSHLAHHRHSQSVDDPKRFGAEHSEDANAPTYRTLDHAEPLLKGPVVLGAAASSLPLRVRQFCYLCVAPLVIGPAVLLFGGEFSLVKRDWRRVESWVALLESAVAVSLLYAASPRLLALFTIALLGGYGFVFFVFASHLSPNQVYWITGRRSLPADALNVSDIHCGALLRWLGNGIADHHSTHHLAPGIPCYRLPAAAAMVEPLLAPFRAPALDLLNPEDCALLYDNYFRAIVETNAVAWDYTEQGALRRMGPLSRVR
jgi:acyl-lipid omega-6 desaturase (Delta-12 desaturase)